MGLEIFSLICGFPFLPGPLERSSTVIGPVFFAGKCVSTNIGCASMLVKLFGDPAISPRPFQAFPSLS